MKGCLFLFESVIDVKNIWPSLHYKVSLFVRKKIKNDIFYIFYTTNQVSFIAALAYKLVGHFSNNLFAMDLSQNHRENFGKQRRFRPLMFKSLKKWYMDGCVPINLYTFLSSWIGSKIPRNQRRQLGVGLVSTIHQRSSRILWERLRIEN